VADKLMLDGKRMWIQDWQCGCGSTHLVEGTVRFDAARSRRKRGGKHGRTMYKFTPSCGGTLSGPFPTSLSWKKLSAMKYHVKKGIYQWPRDQLAWLPAELKALRKRAAKGECIASLAESFLKPQSIISTTMSSEGIQAKQLNVQSALLTQARTDTSCFASGEIRFDVNAFRNAQASECARQRWMHDPNVSVLLVHEPDNPVDANAIKVIIAEEIVGYVPRHLTSMVAPGPARVVKADHRMNWTVIARRRQAPVASAWPLARR